LARAALRKPAPQYFRPLLDRAADRAVEAAGGYDDRYFKVGSEVIRVRCAGGPLAAFLTDAMGHVEVRPTVGAALTVRAWAGDSPPLGDGTHVRRCSADDGSSFVQAGDVSLSALDGAGAVGHLWLRSLRRAADVRVAPLSPILAAWLPSRGVFHAHAGAVGHGDGCLLLAAPSGRGKSTTALACVGAGLGYLGDDACLLAAGPRPMAYSLYRLAQSPQDQGASKQIRHMPPETLVLEAPLRAIAIIAPTGRSETRTAVASAAEAVATIAPSSMLRLPTPREAVLRGLARIAASVPCHHLRAGTDRDRLAAAVRALL
jgi:hypothetical protein